MMKYLLSLTSGVRLPENKHGCQSLKRTTENAILCHVTNSWSICKAEKALGTIEGKSLNLE